MKQYLNKLCEEEAEKISKKRQEQAVLRDELNVCNADILRRKELAKEQERLIEEKVIQFQEEKAVSRRTISTPCPEKKSLQYCVTLTNLNTFSITFGTNHPETPLS